MVNHLKKEGSWGLPHANDIPPEKAATIVKLWWGIRV